MAAHEISLGFPAGAAIVLTRHWMKIGLAMFLREESKRLRSLVSRAGDGEMAALSCAGTGNATRGRPVHNMKVGLRVTSSTCHREHPLHTRRAIGT
jgi:hypothetical protein